MRAGRACSRQASIVLLEVSRAQAPRPPTLDLRSARTYGADREGLVVALRARERGHGRGRAPQGAVHGPQPVRACARARGWSIRALRVERDSRLPRSEA